MIKKYQNNIVGLTLVEIMIGIIITSLMMAAMYTSYSVVNQSYTQVSEKAKISRSSRDLVSMLMRDVRMAGFKYYAGTDQIAKFAEDTTALCGAPGVPLPKLSYLYFENGFDDSSLSHNPIVIRKNTQGAGETTSGNPGENCCDQIQIVYEDFNQNDFEENEQPFKRYRITYYAKPTSTANNTYGVYKRIESYSQPRVGCEVPDPDRPDTVDGLWGAKGSWKNTCNECTPEDVLIRDHIEDMEFIPIDENGKIIRDNAGRYPAPELPSIRDRLYDIRGVDIRLTFRSKDFFFKNAAPTNKQRVTTGLSERNSQSTDRYLRDSVIVSVATRNIGGESF